MIGFLKIILKFFSFRFKHVGLFACIGRMVNFSSVLFANEGRRRGIYNQRKFAGKNNFFSASNVVRAPVGILISSISLY